MRYLISAKPAKGVKRSAKQFLVPGPGFQNNPFVSSINGDWDRLQQQIANTGACFTSKGALGRCTPFRQCYPYFKLPELNNWDTWILGMYDTCSYYTLQGRQVSLNFFNYTGSSNTSSLTLKMSSK